MQALTEEEYSSRRSQLQSVLHSLDRLRPALPNLVGFYVNQPEWWSAVGGGVGGEGKKRFKEGVERFEECKKALEGAKEALSSTFKSAERDGTGIVVRNAEERSKPVEPIIIHTTPSPTIVPPKAPFVLPSSLSKSIETLLDLEATCVQEFPSVFSLIDPKYSSRNSTKGRRRKTESTLLEPGTVAGDLDNGERRGNLGGNGVCWMKVNRVFKACLFVRFPPFDTVAESSEGEGGGSEEGSIKVLKITTYGLLEERQPYESSSHSLFALLDQSLSSTLQSLSPTAPPSINKVLYLLSSYSSLFSLPCKHCNALLPPLHDRNLHTQIGGVQPPTRRLWVGLSATPPTQVGAAAQGTEQGGEDMVVDGRGGADEGKEEGGWWAFHEGCFEMVSR
ncbi:hypothetical protein BT69DRAFT_1333652 [Atractiella rhizophila]|nr:hypothetical protein BT69DRAFT_1333652 [Atractiella rhizophila]